MKSIGNRNWALGLGLSLALIVGLSTNAKAALIARWRFEPGNFLGDSSGNSHTLTVAPDTDVAGSVGGPGSGFETVPTSVTSGLYTHANNVSGSTGAAAFNGTAALVTVNTLGLNTFTQVTVEWFQKDTPVQSEHYPWYAGNPANKNGITGEFSFASQGTFRAFGAANVSTTIADTNWHQYAITIDRTPIGSGGTGLTLYKDYVQVPGEGASGGHNAVAAAAFLNTTFVIGKDYYGGSGLLGRLFNGELDEISVSSGILTPGQFVSQIAVPEPTGVVIFGFGMAGLLATRRRRNRTAVDC